MGKNVQVGDTVRLTASASVAGRYQGRQGTFVGRTGKTGNGKFLVTMGSRRKTALAVLKRDIA